MKILLIDNSLDNTGASKALIKTVAETSQNKLGFIFLFPSNSKCIQSAKTEGFKTYSLKFTEISRRVGDLIVYFPRLLVNTFKTKRLIRQENIYLVHVNDIYNMLGLTVKFLTGIKVITHVRRMPESFPSSIYKIWVRLHVKYADHIIAVSEANKNALPVNNKTTVIYDPLPEAEKLPTYQSREKLQSKINILYLANYTKGKGHLYALQILDRAVREFPDWSFTLNFYGGDFGLSKNNTYKHSLLQFSSKQGLNAFVCFNENTNEIEAVMKAHDLVLNLSDSESFSRTTLEAIFYGIPIIATDVGGTSEMLIDGNTGLLVAPRNVDDMYKGFKKMIQNDSLRVGMASNGYSFVRNQFSKEKTVDKTIEIYNSFDK